MSIEITFTDDNDNQTVVELPSKFELCDDCQGHGTVLNESMRHYAYTAEEFSDFDDDEKHEYFKRGGRYDVPCPTCAGKRVVAVIDVEALKPAHRKAYNAYMKDKQEEHDFRRMQESERRMGA